jgi:hypothetical protein
VDIIFLINEKINLYKNRIILLTFIQKKFYFFPVQKVGVA